jgi:hypothetical protein
MDSSPQARRPIGLTVGPLAFLLAIICGIVVFATLNAFDSFQSGEPTPTPFGPILLDAEYAKLGLAFAAFMTPILLSGMRNAWGPRQKPIAIATTLRHGDPPLRPLGSVTRDEFNRLSVRVAALEPKPPATAPTPEITAAVADAAFAAGQAHPTLATTP